MSAAPGSVWGAVLIGVLAATGAPAQEPAPQQPLSVIDWLDETATPRRDPARPVALPQPGEPPVARSATPPEVQVAPLRQEQSRLIGLVPSHVTGLPEDIWEGSDPDLLARQIARLPDPVLPAAQALLFRLLLTEALPPEGDADGGGALARARVAKLKALGAVDPALALIEQAGPARGPENFAQWMQLSLLAGTEDTACATMRAAPHLSEALDLRIFCAARDGAWEDAALTFGVASALGLMDDARLDLLDRFLHPDFFEGSDPPETPRDMDPMAFRLFETIGEPKPTRNLPRAFAVADLRDVAGWKSQLEAAERLTRAGALPDNLLLGLYTARKPAASGGIWDRVDALQRFDRALEAGDPEAVARALPPAWAAMREAELETAFAELFFDDLRSVPLSGQARALALKIGLLSSAYESAAQDADLLPARPGPTETLALAVARGEAPRRPPEGETAGAVHAAFADPVPRSDLMEHAANGKLGSAILHTLRLLNEGANGDTRALRDALSTLRALGLEDTARRAALQVLLLERSG